MPIDKISAVNSPQQLQRLDKAKKVVDSDAIVAAQDSFVRSSQNAGPNYVKYPYGAPELAMAVLASAAQKVEKRQPEIPVETQDADSWIVVGNVAESSPSHNNETHHYNQQGSKKSEEESADFSDETEEK